MLKKHNVRSRLLDKMAQFALDKRSYIPFWNLNIVWRSLDQKGESILDVGCGTGISMRAILKRKRFYATGADIYRPNLEDGKAHGHFDECIQCDVRLLPFKKKSFDIVLALEVIEHLEKDEALCLLKEMEAIARKQIILSTPVGICPQKPLEGESPYEEHRSYWNPVHFKGRGYTVRGCGFGYKSGDEFLSPRRLPRFLIPLRHLVWLLASPLVYFLPRLAGDMVCTKHLESRNS